MTSPTSVSLRGPLLWVTLVAATGGFLFGYDTAVINGANQYLEGTFRTDTNRRRASPGRVRFWAAFRGRWWRAF